MSSVAAMYHPGLVFATLVVQLVASTGSPVPVVAPRRDCPGCDDDGDEELLINHREIAPRRGGDDCGEDGNPSCTSSSTIPPAPPATSAMATTTTPHNSTSTSTSLPASMTTSMSSTLTPPSASTPTPNPQLVAASHNMSISTGGIIGTAFGAFVIVAASLILCGTFYRRWRRARNHPQALTPSSAYHIGPPPPFEANPREMSQTQSSPLVASAVASRMTSTPPHHYPFTTTSLSPLVPVGASLEDSPSFTSSSNRRTSLSYTDGSSNHEPLQPNSTHEMLMSTSSWSLSQRSMALRSGFTSGLAGIILGSATPPDPTPEPSNLVRSMTAYQKSLEADDQKSSQSGPSPTGDSSKQEEQDITESHDPPPSYDA
ncbi:hypothetical protein HYPSUDRAFT_56311 [Hypholoma sublateritium FD-334 SS-4]|uniref:REJ domain-containing protein n=1 Tax=Hypholoma sublateritium (strain FD-334 SS-4) TaxID=945553 RepID=A0A0D2NMM5_HYPSF|nr:hypothetical protein HYPSUDRAFT_56311 [Hypholoma sublateritium FD-334 SS-4]